jgi:hypothetical protein
MVLAHIRTGDAVMKRISPFYSEPEVINANELMAFTTRGDNDKDR